MDTIGGGMVGSEDLTLIDKLLNCRKYPQNTQKVTV